MSKRDVMKTGPTQTTVSVQFNVSCPNLNRLTHELFLLGSLQELGVWNTDDALEAHPTEDEHIWRVEVFLPVKASFVWIWVKKPRKVGRTEVKNVENETGEQESREEWEKKEKRRQLESFSATLHTVWGEEEEVFLQSVTSVELTTFHKVDIGQRLMVMGSSPTTGLWEVSGAVCGSECPPQSGNWRALVSFDAQSVLSFRWAVVNDVTGEGSWPPTVVQEEPVIHQVLGRRGVWYRAAAAWGWGDIGPTLAAAGLGNGGPHLTTLLHGH